jgi:hypothetical protein
MRYSRSSPGQGGAIDRLALVIVKGAHGFHYAK